MRKMIEMQLKFSDDVLMAIMQMVQLGMLTGTDVVDNFRLMRLVADDEGTLQLSPEFVESFEENIEKMMEDAQRIVAEQLAMQDTPPAEG